MKKSKYIFIIMSSVYLVIAVLYPFGVMKINNNLLLALSVSALFMSISDIIRKNVDYMNMTNTYNAELKITIDFLDDQIKRNSINTKVINVRNYRENCYMLLKKKYKYCHPVDYYKKTIIETQNRISMVVFVLGIAAFILIPFLGVEVTDSKITSIITFLAFAAMTLGVFYDELILEKQYAINTLVNEQHISIQAEYPDFRAYYDSRINYPFDLKASQEKSTQINQ